MGEWQLCWFTKKRMLTKKQARRTQFYINRAVAENGEGKTIKAVYLCEHCDKYHTTSMNQIKHRKFQEQKQKDVKVKKQDQIQERLDYLNQRLNSKKKS